MSLTGIHYPKHPCITHSFLSQKKHILVTVTVTDTQRMVRLSMGPFVNYTVLALDLTD